MASIISKIVFLLLFSFVEVKCCRREDLHYIRITEKPTPLNTTKLFVLSEFSANYRTYNLILSREELHTCDQNLQEYEELARNAGDIQIQGHFIPILRQGDLQNLERLVLIFLESNNIEEVQPGTFLNVPILEVINLQYNNIKEILSGVFNNLNITSLNLNSNSIAHIAPDAFDNMPNLRNINLQNNKLKNWNSAIFTNTPNVCDLLLSSNELTTITQGGFSNVKNSLQILDLSRNHINVIDAATFVVLTKLHRLLLDHNKFECLPDDLLKAFRTDLVLNIAPNENINCACWEKIQQWFSEPKHAAFNADSSIMTTMRHSQLSNCQNEMLDILRSLQKRISVIEKTISSN